MNLKDLKRKIYEENKVITLLENLDCPFIKQEQLGNLIVCGLPDGFNSTNKRTIQIKNDENLTAYIRSRNISGNIFSIIGYVLYNCTTFDETKEKLYQIIQFICNTLDYEIDNFREEKKEEKTDWLYFLRPVLEERKKEFKLDEIPENKPLPNYIMNQYIDLHHIDWYKQGISEKTRKEFGIRYDLKTDRIVFPIYNIKNEIIGVKGRYVGLDTDKTIPKYLFLYKCYKSIELFNLNRALEYINKQKQIIIMESEKATMLAWQWGIKNCVALMGGDLEPTQVYILKKLGIDIELVFMFDKDKNEDYVKKQIKQIKNRKIKIMNDKDNLLNIEKKHSPVDLGESIFYKLIKENLITI